jgi:hypothetical protein
MLLAPVPSGYDWYLRAGLDAEGLRLVAGGNAAGGVGHRWDDGEGAVAVFGMELLLDGSKEAIEVDVEKAEPVGLGGAGHADVGNYIRHLFACRASFPRPEWFCVSSPLFARYLETNRPNLTQV